MRRLKEGQAFFWLAVSALILAGFALRLINNLEIPLFVDEARHIVRAHRITEGQVFAGLDQNKWLYGVVLAGFAPTGPEGPWLARTLSALWGALALAASMALGRRLGGQRAGLWAGLAYAAVPMAVFHERQALTDPQMAALAACATVFSLALARRPSLSTSALLAVTLLAARLTKPAMIAFLGLPFLAVILMTTPRERLKALSLSVGAVIFVLSVTWMVYTLGAAAGVAPRDTHTLSLANTIFGAFGQRTTVIPRLLSDLSTAAQLHVRFYGLPVLIVALWACITTWMQAANRPMLLVMICPAFLFSLVPLLADRPNNTDEMAGRYFLLGAVALCALAGWGAARLADRLQKPALSASLAALIALPGLFFTWQMTFHPQRLRLPAYEMATYPFDRDRFRAAGPQALSAEWRAMGTDKHITLLSTTSSAVIFWQAYLGPRVGSVVPLDQSDPDALPYWLNQGNALFIAEQIQGDPLPPDHFGFRLTPLIERGGSTLYHVTGAQGEAARRIYDLRTASAGSMAADYDALRPELSALAYAFPAEHAVFLGVEAVPLERWPAAPDAGLWAAAPANTPISLVITDEARTDPARIVQQSALEAGWFYAGEGWHGLVHHLQFVSGPERANFEPVNGVFEDAIPLEAAAIVDAQAVPGAHVRLAFRWQTDAPIQDGFNVFVHLVDAQGALIAQHDGVPGAGLLPTTAWQPGEVIEDRVAIQLPAEAAPGRLEVRVGLYTPASGLRLRVTAGPGGSDYLSVGQLVVFENP